MNPEPPALPLVPAPTARPGRFVNPRCIIHEEDGLRVAMVDGDPFHTWVVGDTLGENLFVVQARQAQVATIIELANALGRPDRTLFLAFRQYTEGGVLGVVPKRRGAVPGASRDVLRDAAVRRFHAAGLSGRAIARRLGTSPLTVQRALTRLGLEPNVRRQSALSFDAPVVAPPDPLDPATPDAPPAAEPSTAAASEPPAGVVDTITQSEASAVDTRAEDAPARSLDLDPLQRSMDRFLASQGALDDAAPLFASGRDLPHVGVLLAIPGLVQSGLLPEARRLYGDIGPAFYGLRTTLVLLVLLSLLRLKRPEHVKEFSPPDLGRVLGLDRVPEVKTLRRKLHRLAQGASEALLLAVARRRAATREDAIAWQYVDGHVRVYSGANKLPKAHVTRMRISLPASQDVWVHDGEGRPILFVTQEAHPSLAATLRPVLEATREVTGIREVTLVFDRGGWSPELFAALVKDGAHVLTYRKGPFELVPEASFEPRPGRPGEKDWLLHDASVRLPGGLWMRQITRLVGTHQTAIVTTRQDLPAEELALRMFNRWRQENFFKYMRQEYDLDGLVQYGADADDPIRETPNPDWARRDKALRAAHAAHRAMLATHPDRAHAETRAAAATVEELQKQRAALPRRVKVRELADPTLRLPARVKNLYDGLKTLAWQVETDLFHAIAPFYKRNDDEGRTLVTTALRSSGSLEVTDEELLVTLAPQSSPHRTRVVAALCSLLNDTDTRFPGTNLRLRYAIDTTPTGGATAKSGEG